MISSLAHSQLQSLRRFARPPNGKWVLMLLQTLKLILGLLCAKGPGCRHRIVELNRLLTTKWTDEEGEAESPRPRHTEKAINGGSCPIAPLYEKGARFTTPSDDIVDTSAIGRGTYDEIING
eukprot:2927256-Pyramimonas_sp.AAC.1